MIYIILHESGFHDVENVGNYGDIVLTSGQNRGDTIVFAQVAGTEAPARAAR